MNNIQRPYFIGLDVLRLIAALAVFIFHLQIHYWVKDIFKITFDDYLGRLGVSFFFVLSGFLLTYLLFFEFQETKKVNIPKFYMRRASRIWPLYFVVLIIGFFIYPFLLKLITGYQYTEKASPLMYFFYLANYDVLKNGLTTPILGVQWSLSVEEQFYIVLPFLFIIAFSKKLVGVVLSICLILFSVNYKLIVHYYDSLSVMYNLFMGVLLAILTVNYKSYLMTLFYNNVVIAFFIFGFIFYLSWIQLFGVSSINMFCRVSLELTTFSFFIFYFSFNQKIINFITSNKLLSLIADIGKRYTYSIYLLHMLAIVFTQLLVHQLFKIDSFSIYVITSVFVLIFLCYIAERFIEKPFLKLKQRFY